MKLQLLQPCSVPGRAQVGRDVFFHDTDVKWNSALPALFAFGENKVLECVAVIDIRALLTGNDPDSGEKDLLMGKDVDERGLWVIHHPWQPGYLCAGCKDKEQPGHHGHKGWRRGRATSQKGALEEIQLLKAACGISAP